MKRLFVALDLPDSVKTWLVEHLPPISPGLRRVQRDPLHLTVAFIGEADMDSVLGALQTVTVRPFRLRIHGLGSFQGAAGHTIFWAGMDPSTGLLDLHGRVADALETVGVRRETRRYNPHITLARSKKRPSPAQEIWLRQGRDLVGPEFEVDRWVLYSSQLLPAGPVYSREKVGG